MLSRRTLVSSLLALPALHACDRVAQGSDATTPLRVAMDLWAGYYPAFLADELGYLREAGIAVTLAVPGDTDRMVSEFAAGRHDLICVSLGDLINLTRGRGDVQVVMVADESAGGDQIFVRHGVDLRGRNLRVVTNLGGFGELFMREFLARRGVDVAGVVWVNADAAKVPALVSGSLVDIAHTWEPYASQIDRSSAEPVFSSADTPGLIPDVLASSSAVLERRGPDVRRLIAAWLRAQTWWLANPAEGNRMLSRRLKIPLEQATPQGVRLIGLQENRRLLGADGPPQLAAVVSRYSDFFLARGQLTRPVDPGSLLRGSLLP